MNWDQLLRAVHVWHREPDALRADALRERCLGWLNAQEKAHLTRLCGDRLKRDYLAAHALCRAALSRYTNVDPADWRFSKSKHGKPAILAPRQFRSMRFNLTHTVGLAACAITRAGKVGVDAEEIARSVDVDQVARHFFSEAEQKTLAELLAARRRKRFFEIWVLKEAFLKGSGTGLWKSPEKVTIKLDRRGRAAPIRRWQLSLHRPTPRHVAAVAVNSHRPLKISWFPVEDLFEARVAVV